MDVVKKGHLLSFFSRFLEVFEAIYTGGLDIYLGLEKVGLRRRFRSPIPVISIGNLSVGGTGKTPATIAIAKALHASGIKLVVLSRGHGGSLSKQGAVVSDGEGNVLLSADEAGDEPVALALAMRGVPVLVGKDRRKTARIAVERFQPDILLLDDGFQYWQLHRDVDVVLLDSLRPFENGHCLPRGLLRESKSHLNRAGVVIVSRSGRMDEKSRTELAAQIGLLAPSAEMFFARHSVEACLPANAAAKSEGYPECVLALCAIARPDSFLESLRESSISPLATLFLPDHHRYRSADARSIIGKMNKLGAKSVVTTQKDFVKVGRLLQDVPVYVQPIIFDVENESTLLSELLERVHMPQTLATMGDAAC
jgi:tetraacyldisaccharide 4'-kinase